ncbi:hypothetical protein Gpo141_00010923 [Globisporangium polare]
MSDRTQRLEDEIELLAETNRLLLEKGAASQRLQGIVSSEKAVKASSVLQVLAWCVASERAVDTIAALDAVALSRGSAGTTNRTPMSFTVSDDKLLQVWTSALNAKVGNPGLLVS